MWYPKSDASYSLELQGKFYSPAFTTDTDTTFWTTQEPRILIMAACLMREFGLGVRTRIDAASASLEAMLSALDDEQVELELLGGDLKNWEFDDAFYR